MTQEKLDQQKSELEADLLVVSRVEVAVWKHHPDNPNKKDVVQEYNILKQILTDIESELAELEK